MLRYCALIGSRQRVSEHLARDATSTSVHAYNAAARERYEKYDSVRRERLAATARDAEAVTLLRQQRQEQRLDLLRGQVAALHARNAATRDAHEHEYCQLQVELQSKARQRAAEVAEQRRRRRRSSLTLEDVLGTSTAGAGGAVMDWGAPGRPRVPSRESGPDGGPGVPVPPAGVGAGRTSLARLLQVRLEVPLPGVCPDRARAAPVACDVGQPLVFTPTTKAKLLSEILQEKKLRNQRLREALVKQQDAYWMSQRDLERVTKSVRVGQARAARSLRGSISSTSDAFLPKHQCVCLSRGCSGPPLAVQAILSYFAGALTTPSPLCRLLHMLQGQEEEIVQLRACLTK